MIFNEFQDVQRDVHLFINMFVELMAGEFYQINTKTPSKILLYRTHNSKCQMEVTACLTGKKIEVAYDGHCRGQGQTFPGIPEFAAVEQEEEEEDCPDICRFNYKPVCGTGEQLPKKFRSRRHRLTLLGRGES